MLWPLLLFRCSLTKNIHGVNLTIFMNYRHNSFTNRSRKNYKDFFLLDIGNKINTLIDIRKYVDSITILPSTGETIDYHRPGLPSHKVRNGVHMRYKVFRNGVHLWVHKFFSKLKAIL